MASVDRARLIDHRLISTETNLWSCDHNEMGPASWLWAKGRDQGNHQYSPTKWNNNKRCKSWHSCDFQGTLTCCASLFLSIHPHLTNWISREFISWRQNVAIKMITVLMLTVDYSWTPSNEFQFVVLSPFTITVYRGISLAAAAAGFVVRWGVVGSWLERERGHARTIMFSELSVPI